MSGGDDLAAADFAKLAEPAIAAGRDRASEVLQGGGDPTAATIAGNLAAVMYICKALHRRIFEMEEQLTEPGPPAGPEASPESLPGVAPNAAPIE